VEKDVEFGVEKNWAQAQFQHLRIGQLGKWAAINKTSQIRTTFI